MKKAVFSLSLLFVSTIASIANAGFQFDLDAPSYGGLTPGQTVTTSLYVSATGGDIPNFSSLNGVSFNLVGSGGDTTITSFTLGPGWAVGSASAPSGTTLNQSSLAGFVTPSSGRALIGTLTFTAGSFGTTTSYSFVDPAPAPATNVSGFVSGTSTSLDSQVFNSPSVSFAVAVPEPSSVGVLALFGLAAIRRRRR